VSTLEEIEAIKNLKARYFRLLDTQQWEQWAEVFSPDVEADFREGPGETVQGRDAVVKMVSSVLREAKTIHHGHMPEIEILDPKRAKGIWAMFDIVEHPAFSLQGYGHYIEEYTKEDGQWRICKIKLTRLKVDRTLNS